MQFAQRQISKRQLAEEITYLTPAVVFVAIVSSQTGFNHHLRYIAPAFPFVFVWMAMLGRSFDRTSSIAPARVSASNSEDNATRENLPVAIRSCLEKRWNSRILRQAVITLLLAWSGLSSALALPHVHSYFNELAGGSSRGWKHLHSSNVEWGYDLTYLQKWLDGHPEVDEIGIVSITAVELEKVFPKAVPVNRWPLPKKEALKQDETAGPIPGWYAISMCELAGRPDVLLPSIGDELQPSAPGYAYFRQFTPEHQIGNSLNIYSITLQECNRVRRLLGLIELPPDWKR